MKNRHLALLWILATATLLPQCGKDGVDGSVIFITGDDPSENDEKKVIPEVVSTTPEKDATDIDIFSSIEATFSQTMDSASVVPSTFVVQNNSANISGKILYDGTTASFRPDNRMILGETYTATLDSGIMNESGINLAEHQWSFQTRNGAWKPTYDLVFDQGNSSDGLSPQIAMTHSGNAVATWIEQRTSQISDDNRFNVMTSEYRPDPTTGMRFWSPAVARDTDLGEATTPHIRIDDSENIHLAWLQRDGVNTGSYSPQAARYKVSTNSWEGPFNLEGHTDDTQMLKLVVNSNGNAMAVWRKIKQTSGGSIWTNRFNLKNGSWLGSPERVTADGNFPDVALNDSDVASVISRENNKITVVMFDPSASNGAGAWQAERRIDSDTGSASDPAIGLDASGRPVAVWIQPSNNKDSLWTNSDYDPTTDLWTTSSAMLLESRDNTPVRGPDLSVNAKGEAAVVWAQDLNGFSSIYANRRVFNSTLGQFEWTGATPLEKIDSDAFGPKVRITPNGTVHVVWKQSDTTGSGRFDIMNASFFTGGGGWTTATSIENDNIGNAEAARIAVSPFGEAMAVWRQESGALWQIRSNRFE